MLSHETPGPTSLWPFPAEAGMRPELVHCACLQANASASYCQLNIETARPSSFSFFVSFFFIIFFYRALCGCCSRQPQYSQAKIPHQNLRVGSHGLKTFPLRLCVPFWPPKTFHPHPAPKLEGDGYPSEQGSHGLQTWPQGWEPFRSPGEMPPMWPCLVMSPQCGRHLGPRLGHIGSTH